MYQSIIIPLLLLVLLGSIGIFTITKKRPKEAKKLWVKYYVYLLLLCLNIVLIVWSKDYYILFMYLFWALGLYEILKISKNKHIRVSFFMAIVIYLICAFLFFRFLFLSTGTLILFFYITILTMDAFSQIFGQLFGKNKITSISPNKTYEGLFGGLIMCIVVGFCMKDLVLPIHNFNLIICSLCIGIIGFLGDLLASYLKRYYSVKDFSNLLPGQGGVLDRYDGWFISGLSFLILSGLLNIL